ncbi:hypothetical protein EW145_g6273 [Phellinidium pouzarii]|uniref:Uncharacterized protein n=1 Tax=Phellinidium pouzarii TaxID=167371 RepID=A0A4V3XBV9_9AGAM|nr:hypothetical protein EW145_g6273 [Phellinidium pouzarii]
MVSQLKTQAHSRKPCHSYAECVVTAVSDICKRTQRDSIHLKTLTTQVQKNAEAQQDQLGPYWKAWVKSACDDLTTRTLFDSASPRGHVALTPEGKRRIAKMLHSIPENHEHSSYCKENAGWLKLVRELPKSGSKHAKKSSARLQSTNENGTSHSGKKALPRMTKAELLVEVEELRSALEQLSYERDTLENEKSQEVKRLIELLEAQDDELLEMRDELFLQKEAEVELGDITMVDDEIVIAFDETHSPPSYVLYPVDATDADHLIFRESDNNNNIERFPETKDNSRKLLKPPVAISLMHTQSGSFISSISKQPTPLPSESGSEPSSPMPVDDYLDAELGPFDPDCTYVDSSGETSLDPQETNGSDKSRAGLQVYTLLSTPPPPLKRTDGSSWGEIDLERRRRIEELVEERNEARRELQIKVASLKKRDDDVLFLKAQIIRHSSENKKFEEVLTSLLESVWSPKKDILSHHANELLITNEQLQEREKEISEVRAMEEEASTKLREAKLESEKTKATSASLASQLRSVAEALEESNADRETLRAKLSEALDETHSVKSEIRDRIEQTEAEAVSLREGIRISNDQAAKLRLETEAALARFEKEQRDRLRLELEVSAAQMAHAAYKKDTENNILGLQEDIDKTTTMLKERKKEIEVVRANERMLHEDLLSSMEQVEGLSTQLESADARFSNLQKLFDTKEAELLISRNELERARQQGFVLQEFVATLQTQLNAIDVEKGKLREMLKDAEERAENLDEYCRGMIKRQREQCEDMERHMNKKRKRTPFDSQSYLVHASVVAPAVTAAPVLAADDDSAMSH